MKTQSQTAFTLVELLVVIAIIGTLVALLLPAVNMARAAARKNACLNNIGQCALGVSQFETNKGRYPGYVERVKRNATQYAVINGAAMNGALIDGSLTPTESWISWAGMITPYIDENPIWDSLRDPEVISTDPRAQIRQTAIVICPADSDLTSLSDNAGMSFVANTGAWDYDTSGNYLPGGDTKANGLFHNRSLGNTKVMITDIKDGASSTVMLSENYQKPSNYTWLGVQAPNSSQMFSTPRGEAQFGMVWITGGGTSQPVSSLIVSSAPDLVGINRQAPFSWEDGINFTESIPGYVRPSSNHPAGLFNAAFADNHARSFSADLDAIVWQQLMAPHNAKCVDPMDHTIGDPPGNDSPMYDYRNAPPVSVEDLN